MNLKKIVILVLACFLATTLAYAQDNVNTAAKKAKGASAKAYEKASDKAIFNRVSDWFATIGKSDEEKAKIIAERDAKRAQKRAEKEARKKAKELKKQGKQARERAQNEVRERSKNIKKSMGKAAQKMKGSKKGR